MQLPNKSRFSVISDGKLLQEQTQNYVDLSVLTKPTYEFFNKKLKMDLANLSKEELQFYSKNKTSSMYQKYNMHRFLIAIMFGACAFLGYKMFKSKKVINVSSSVLIELIKQKFKKHPKIVELQR